ncbi:PREDICTED: uncharacterized PKHD-type hydroxylase At1g22950-like [Camelina sativa]|uniref:Uncharacterized PKHD-type hydroxylase At1g22950-like n=1 Tax=Camelina sativa TaxID=90675 RepID=A0ABM0VVJ0_CAMSA|nr:PREDICTED: uncharacterized PKHD-type hydroxylase At1g22950-like [Camelina sativa]XP_019091302.1 PREDICTED: uncharacterized PKHD-type hydroxylase At1g22950-like [Camelina sativa]
MAVDGDETNGGGDSQPSVNTTAEKKKETPILRLSLVPNNEYVSDSYDDPNLVYSSCVLRSLEKYLPPEIFSANRNEKAKFMSDILRKYFSKAKRLKNRRQEFISKYQPSFRGWYDIDPKLFLLPSFLEAISDNTEASFRRIISEPHPSVFVFQMFQPDFYETVIVEVENIRKWAEETNFPIRRPNNMSKHGVVLDHFGLDIFLKKLIQEFIFPLCKVFFPEVCGTMFDSHHGFFIETGEDRDPALGLHMDLSEITLNVCLKKQFEGGEIIFGGTRCKKHKKTKFKDEAIFRYSHIPGQAILHRGRHCHGANTTRTTCYRANMILCCNSSLFREMETYQKDFSDWCGQCAHETKVKESQIIAARREGMIRIEDGARGSTDKPWHVYVRRSKK